MGKKSAAALSIVPKAPIVTPEPADLSKAESAIWRSIVGSEPPGFFSSVATLTLLKTFCQHQSLANEFTATIAKFPAAAIVSSKGRQFETLLKCRDREARAAADILTKLRLTNQSRYTPQAAGTAGQASSPDGKPWE